MPNQKLGSLTLIIMLIFLLFSNGVFALNDQKYEKVVLNFVDCVKSGNKQELIKLIRFPLSRVYPLPGIKTPEEFLLRFNEVFDKELIKKISNSHLDDWSWSDRRCRKIMFQEGSLLLDYDGKVIYINLSEIEEQKRIEMINAEKKTLYSGLRNYQEPVLEWKTKRFRIRIDKLTWDEYRYACWAVNKQTNEKPDLILNNGEKMYDGTEGNHHYDFLNGIYTYRCSVWETDQTAELEVYKNDTLLLNEPVIEKLNR